MTADNAIKITKHVLASKRIPRHKIEISPNLFVFSLEALCDKRAERRAPSFAENGERSSRLCHCTIAYDGRSPKGRMKSKADDQTLNMTLKFGG